MAELSFNTLRTWNGEQSRAFEELSYQLLKDQVPVGTHAIRTGNPDGGVEWYATLPDGAEWGWQAKHVSGIDALLTAMTDSVKRVAKERTDLRKLTFAISWNLSTGTSGGERKSQRQKYLDKVNTWKKEVKGADKIEFCLKQESDLLDELAKPEHRGRRWFWWDQVVLGPDWLKERYREQVDAATEKYRPDLQVDIPIQDDLLALGFDQVILETFDRMRRDIASNAAHIDLWSKHEDETVTSIVDSLRHTARRLRSVAELLDLQAGGDGATLEPLLSEIEIFRADIIWLNEHLRRADQQWRDLPGEEKSEIKKPSELISLRGAYKLRTAIDDFDYWLESSVGKSFLHRTYLLTGQAGAGKTHLLLDATRRALDADRPAVFLAGAQFGRGDLWISIADQLGLPAHGSDVLLSAMDAAGEAASTTGRRFVVFIDALNDTTPPDFWRTSLPRLRAAITRYPHVALAVSCRDTYREVVCDNSESARYVNQQHPGFAEREVEAAQRYFDHYHLEAPKIPLLTPEFTLPLFLRLYCESLASTDSPPPPAGHLGRIEIFERYLKAKVSTVARRLRPAATSGYELSSAKSQVIQVLDAILDELSRAGREAMSLAVIEPAVREAVRTSGDDPIRILGLLQEEGVLTREQMYFSDRGFEEGIRIVFQAFSDFLLLKRRVSLSADPLHDMHLREWLGNECSYGIREAATVFFPEEYGIELPDLLGLELRTESDNDNADDYDDIDWRMRRLYSTFVETLPYRKSDAITQRTIDLLNDAQLCVTRAELYRALFTLAPQPGNRLNALGLHKYLTDRPMPERDGDFGIATYDELMDAFGPVARLARWAAAGPYVTYSAEVVELAAIPLCWLLSSPNRFMRDWVTKALTQLLQGHLDVMRKLIERFWEVDDPYVVQRVMAIAYGSLLRSSTLQRDHATQLAASIHQQVFSPPVRADELMLDAARGVVKWAVLKELLPGSSLDALQRPLGIKLPDTALTESQIKDRYGWKEGQPDDESYSQIVFSLTGLSDFGRYVVEPGVGHFSCHKIGEEYPPDPPRDPVFQEDRWSEFKQLLSEDQVTRFADRLSDPKRLHDDLTGLNFILSREEDPLTEEQRRLLDAAFEYPARIDHEYPGDEAKRWVLGRTISLGWTPKLFGEFDRRIVSRGRGREGHKAERWGKKYQWMAYHELLARVADNYQPSTQFDKNATYDGLYQIVGDREIDPSLPPIDFRIFNDHGGKGATAWGPCPVQLVGWPAKQLNFGRYKGDIYSFLDDVDSEPAAKDVLFVRDAADKEWIVLECEIKQVDPLAHEGWRGLQQDLAIDSFLIRTQDGPSFSRAAVELGYRSVLDGIRPNSHVNCCYVAEVGRAEIPCVHRRAELEGVEFANFDFRVVPTTESYGWEGSTYDCSIGETARTSLPSTFFQQTSNLLFDINGPSWLDADRSPIFTHYQQEGSSNYAFLVRASFLREFLARHNLQLVTVHWMDRSQLGLDEDDKICRLDTSHISRVTSTLNVSTTEMTREEYRDGVRRGGESAATSTSSEDDA